MRAAGGDDGRGPARARRVPALVTIIGTAAALAAPHPGAAQSGCAHHRCPSPGAGAASGGRWSGELQVAGVNVLLGGLTAGLRSQARGGSFTRAFAHGALGGAGVYAGKRLAVARFTTAGLLGRQVAAVGASVVRNAGDEQASFDRLVLPVWLGRVHLDRRGPVRLQLRADLATVLATAFAVSRRELRLDVAASASAGVPVFLASDGYQGEHWEGRHAAGVVWLRESLAQRDGGSMRSHVLAHEVVHAVQNDFAFVAWSLPGEERVRRRTLGPVARYVDLGLQAPALGVVSPLAGYERRPWEREAHFLAGTR